MNTDTNFDWSTFPDARKIANLTTASAGDAKVRDEKVREIVKLTRLPEFCLPHLASLIYMAAQAANWKIWVEKGQLRNEDGKKLTDWEFLKLQTFLQELGFIAQYETPEDVFFNPNDPNSDIIENLFIRW